MSFSFNGISKDYVRALRGIERPTWAPIEHEIIEIPGHPGGYEVGENVKVRVINIPVEVRGASSENLQSLKEEIAGWLITEEPKELKFDDEPNRVYYAKVTGELNLSEILNKGKGVITFVCSDPYKYGEEQEVIGPFQVTLKEDFVGKVVNSEIENPHRFRGNTADKKTLVLPSNASADVTQADYDSIKNLDGNVSIAYTTTINQEIAQHLFSFNLIQAIERKYGAIPSSDKVGWLKANIKRLTANWHGRGSTLVANPITKADFVGKVTGSVTENPHNAKRTASTGPEILRTPTSSDFIEFVSDDGVQSYQKLMASDGQTTSISTSGANTISQHLFSFNLIEHVQRKYNFTIPGATTADKVAWLKANVTRLTANWWGKGSGPSGNKATIKMWRVDTSIWDNNTIATHALGVVSKLVSGSTSPNIRVDSNGFVHFLAYADPSDGTTASRIETDFIELEVEVKSGYKATFSVWEKSNNSWVTSSSHGLSGISKLSYINNAISGTSIFNDDGIVHFLAYADPSNGLAPSRIETDYIELEIESVLSHLPLIIENEGTAESYPVITAKLKKSVTFVAVGNGEDINMIGEPVSVDDVVFEPKTIVLNDPMTSTVGWGAAGFTPDGSIKAGTITSDGNNLVASSYGTGSAWHGPAVQKSLGQQLQDFSVEFTFNCSSRTIAELGKVQLYGLDATNKKIFMLGMADYWNSRESNMPEGFLYNATEQRKEILVRNADDKFERFYGYMRITRIGREIEFFLKQVDLNGNEIATKRKTYFDSNNEYQAQLSSVGIHVAQYGTYLPIESLGASHATVTRINQQSGIPLIGRAGDIVIFDNKQKLITLNGEDINDEKAFIGKYFSIKPGQIGIVAEPFDALEEIKVRWNPAWR